jgi:hypothetical protein
MGLTVPPYKNPTVRKSKEGCGPLWAAMPKMVTMNKITIMSVSVPYQHLNKVAHFYEIQYGNRNTEGDLDAIIFNPIASSF